ncbi:hypothetical protein Megvenef_01376 [Candidatus Megaera venefica]|uniref:Phage protein n=1 Tax=Candidatus Megaera venefica TaxID=2055910 RepID=A0ABU5NDZ1_9RICK|nr:hypothetical protein [Candidatus Megaera venefica]MEA0971398.1 hypothetical protein [Candidatus Megaera venefica]
MNFIEAVKLLNDGNGSYITRNPKASHMFVYKSYDVPRIDRFTLVIKKLIPHHGIGYAPYEPRLDEILANDWEIYKKEPELHTFEEAIKLMKEGKTIKRKLWATKVIERDFCDDYSVEFTIDDFEANDWIIVEEEV